MGDREARAPLPGVETDAYRRGYADASAGEDPSPPSAGTVRYCYWEGYHDSERGSAWAEIVGPSKPTPRKGARGPERDHATDRRVIEIRAALQNWGFAATAPQIAVALSFERGELVTADAVRARLKHHSKGQSPAD